MIRQRGRSLQAAGPKAEVGQRYVEGAIDDRLCEVIITPSCRDEHGRNWQPCFRITTAIEVEFGLDFGQTSTILSQVGAIQNAGASSPILLCEVVAAKCDDQSGTSSCG